MGAILLLLLGCAKDTDNEPDNNGMYFVEVNVENGSEYASIVDKVCAVAGNTLNNTFEIIAEAPYGNGRFTLGLPGKVNDKLLVSLENTFNITDIENLQISDRTAKITEVTFYALKVKGEESVGIIGRYSFDPTSIFSEIDFPELMSLYESGVYTTTFIYANKPVTVNGTFIDIPIQYNLTLKTGWNKCIHKITAKLVWTDEDGLKLEQTIEVVNDEPTGMKWYFVN